MIYVQWQIVGPKKINQSMRERERVNYEII